MSERLFTIYYPSLDSWVVTGCSIGCVRDVAFEYIQSIKPFAKIKYLTVVEELTSRQGGES